MDLTKTETRIKAVRNVFEDEPLVLIGSLLCTDWSTMMNVQDRRGRKRIRKTHSIATSSILPQIVLGTNQECQVFLA